MKPLSYAIGKHIQLSDFVRRHFPNLSHPAATLFHYIFPDMERLTNAGVCGLICKPYDTWAPRGFQHKLTTMNAMKTLAKNGLIDFRNGDKKRGLSIQVRRRRIDEIQAKVPREVLHAVIPQRFDDLAECLRVCGVCWHGKMEYPQQRITVTGRITTAKPSLHNKSDEARVAGLLPGLKSDEILFYADFKAAEPTVICHYLAQDNLLPQGYTPDNLYDLLASCRGVKRSVAKQQLLAMLYCRSKNLTVPDEWHVPVNSEVRPFIDAVNVYRTALWERSAPTEEHRRHVFTIGGRPIEVNGQTGRMHRGKFLSWQIQGSVADIGADIVDALLKGQKEGRWRFLLQVHDGFYVSGPANVGADVAELMQKTANAKGVHMEVKVHRHPPRKAAREARGWAQEPKATGSLAVHPCTH